MQLLCTQYRNSLCVCVCVYACVHVCACVRACARACVHVCVRKALEHQAEVFIASNYISLPNINLLINVHVHIQVLVP